MKCAVCGRPATHVAFAGFDVYGCALCPASDVNPPVVIANTLTAKRAAASSGGPVMGNEMAFEELRAKYIRVDKERLYLIEENEAILQMLVDMAKKHEPDNHDLHIFLANRMKN